MIVTLVLLFFAIVVFFYTKKQVTSETVWTYWHSPFRPAIVNRCIENWRRVGHRDDIRILDSYSVYTWIPTDVMDQIHRVAQKEAHKSDLIRLYLLKTYGGIWMDASVFLTTDLSWIEDSFFCYRADRFTKDDVVCLENFFIKAPKAHPVIIEWYDTVLKDLGDPDFMEHNTKYVNIVGKNAKYLTAYISSMKINKDGIHTESAEEGPHFMAERYGWKNHEAICKNMSYESKIMKLYRGPRNACPPSLIPMKTVYSRIPKVLIQTYSDIKKVPPRVFENIKKYAGEYTYEFFDDTRAHDFILEHYGEIVARKFKTLSVNAHKADLFRYCYLFMKGGVYMDIKIELMKPLRDIFDEDYTYTVLSSVQNSIHNAIIVSAPRNEMFRGLINFMVNGSDKPSYLSNCREFYKIAKQKIGADPVSGKNKGQLYFLDEGCVDKKGIFKFGGTRADGLKIEKTCYDGPDRYGLCCHIYDKGKAVFKSRYSDFPW